MIGRRAASMALHVVPGPNTLEMTAPVQAAERLINGVSLPHGK